jgi:phage shock protein PspC (stress-responsive transcriptional regulator)
METTANISNIKRLERPASGRVLAGVCAGLGRYFDLSPTFYRLGFVVLTLLGGAGILVYLAAVLVIPVEGNENSIAAEALADRREKPWPLVGIALIGVALAVGLAHSTIGATSGAGWFLILIVGIGVLWASRGGSRGRVLVRVLVASFVTLLVALIAAVAITIAWFDVGFSDGVGSRVYHVGSVSGLQSTYHLGVGRLELDLQNIGPVTHTTVVHAKVDVGNLVVTVPAGLNVVVNAHAKVGSLDVLNRHDDGHNAALKSGQGANLVIDATVGAGHVEVDRAGQ